MRKSVRNSLLVGLGGLSIAALAVPMLLPIPPLRDAVPPESLADEDSRFLDVGGVRVHYKVAGHGSPVFVLLHGFGASLFTWREVVGPLSQVGTVVVFDRPAFGLTERPLKWEGENPYSPSAQSCLTVALLDHLGADRAILVGNSAGGSIAILTALDYPERVHALILGSPAVYSGGGAPGWILPVLRTPQMRRLGPLLLRQMIRQSSRLVEMAWFDPSRITDDILEGYRLPLLIHDWDRALWEFTLASGKMNLPLRLPELHLPTLVIAGEEDRIVPAHQSIRLANEIDGAQLRLIPRCGHVPQEECPDEFMAAVREFVQTLYHLPVLSSQA